MMYIKLIWRNARRSFKDYLIYMVTLTLCVTMFYSFLSISSQYYQPDIGVEYNLDIVSDNEAGSFYPHLVAFGADTVCKSLYDTPQAEGICSTDHYGHGAEGDCMVIFRRNVDYGAVFSGTWNFGRRSVFPVYHRHVDECFWERISVHMAFVSRYHWNYGGLFPSLFCLNRFFSSAVIRKIKIIDMLKAQRKNEEKVTKSNGFTFWQESILWCRQGLLHMESDRCIIIFTVGIPGFCMWFTGAVSLFREPVSFCGWCGFSKGRKGIS